MKLEDVTKIKNCYDDKETNMYLDKGYKLLRILSSKTINDTGETVTPVCVLGLKKKKN